MPIDNAYKYNTKVKIYPDGQSNITYCNRRIFSDKTNAKDTEFVNEFDEIIQIGEKQRKNPGESVHEILQDEQESSYKSDNRTDILKRAREKVFDICYCNDWKYFLTVTIDPKQMDSADKTVVMEKLNIWLRNQVTRRGLQYILVPERHKKGGIHCHALINDCFDFVDSGRIRVGKKSYDRAYCDRQGIAYSENDYIYNLPQWRYGWSTALPVYDSGAKLAVYITKYVTKGNDKIFGRYYWSSRNIIRSPEIMYMNTDFETVEAESFEVPNTEFLLKYESNITYEHKGT